MGYPLGVIKGAFQLLDRFEVDSRIKNNYLKIIYVLFFVTILSISLIYFKVTIADSKIKALCLDEEWSMMVSVTDPYPSLLIHGAKRCSS